MTLRAEATKSQLCSAALAVVREQGLTAASARTIATAAEVNQALIFYHFGSVSELIEAASNALVEERVGLYRDAFASARSLSDLLAIARDVHERERVAGSMTVMAQLMAGAPADPVLARATRHAIAAWTTEVEQVLQRVLVPSPVGLLVGPAGLAQLVSATFVGLELHHGADPAAADQAFGALERLSALLTALDGLAPAGQRALRLVIAQLSKRT